MVKCSAYRCASATYNKTPGLTFHQFPKDESTRNAWLKNMKRQDWQPNNYSVLCSKHFEDHLFDAGCSRTRLRSRAIPTLFNEFPLVIECKENGSRRAIILQTTQRTTTGTVIPVLQQVQNKVHVASTSTMTETPVIKEEKMTGTSKFTVPAPSQPQVPVSGSSEAKVESLKKRLISKNKKLKALRQQRTRLRKKVSQFSEIISELKDKLNDDDIHILKNIPGDNKDFKSKNE